MIINRSGQSLSDPAFLYTLLTKLEEYVKTFGNCDGIFVEEY